MHESVLLKESIDNLNLKENSIIVDCTLGYGGHSSEILKRISKGYLYAFDQDEEAITYAKERLNAIAQNYEIIHTNFVNLKEEMEKRNVNPDGILFDLGVSSPQLDEAERGFSYHKDARLDMRMNQEQKLSAYEVVNNYSYEKLKEILLKYGEEKYAGSIAKGIINKRKSKSIETTLELAEIVKESVPEKYRNKSHPARKTFQAIRIEVNDELNVFEKALKESLELIKPGGRICVITFHSLEDKICKKIFNESSSLPPELKKLPIVPKEYEPKYKLIASISPTDTEIAQNKRSRSSHLRVIERR